jgi:hypothetical protein
MCLGMAFFLGCQVAMAAGNTATGAHHAKRATSACEPAVPAHGAWRRILADLFCCWYAGGCAGGWCAGQAL